jgi:hypothetical protein
MSITASSEMTKATGDAALPRGAMPSNTYRKPSGREPSKDFSVSDNAQKIVVHIMIHEAFPTLTD